MKILLALAVAIACSGCETVDNFSKFHLVDGGAAGAGGDMQIAPANTCVIGQSLIGACTISN